MGIPSEYPCQMTTVFNERNPAFRRLSTTQNTVRSVIGVARIIAGLLVLSGIITEIVDTLAHSAFKPDHYFAYFTIESSMMNVVVLVVGGVFAVRHPVDTRLLSTVRMAVLSYAVVTAIVYNVLLRNIPSNGDYQGPHWPTEVFHVAIPILLVLDWILTPGRVPVRWRSLALVASYPLAWLAFTMIRGGLGGWYPYPFLEPGGPGGVLSVVIYCVVLTAVILGFACAAIAISRAGSRQAGRPAAA